MIETLSRMKTKFEEIFEVYLLNFRNLIEIGMKFDVSRRLVSTFEFLKEKILNLLNINDSDNFYYESNNYYKSRRKSNRNQRRR